MKSDSEKTILVCFGTRAEAIKMAPLCYALQNKGVNYKICVTAQHREMLDQVLNFFKIKPDYDLDLMQPGQTLNALSSRIISTIDVVLEDLNPEMVLVHGDTTTAAMVALASFHRKIKVGHVEAGLRTYNKYAPYPEEINRQLISRVADIHFAPTETAKENLEKEGTIAQSILVTGNTIVDALFFGIGKMKNGYVDAQIEVINKKLNFDKKIVLVTGHRRESFGEGFENLSNALIEISKRKDVEIVYPVHMNPNVQEPIYKLLSNRKNIHLIQPVEYPAMIWLMQKCYMIITDSGGIQEEAPSLGKPVLVTRSTSERPEGIKKGFSKLIGTDKEAIINETIILLDNLPQLDAEDNPYGDGHASLRIVNYLSELLCFQ